jgi:hypothetical protein
MPDLPNQLQSDDQDLNELIAEAAKQYEVYIEINQLTSILNCGIPVENYQRDLSHPLSIQLKG